ncbi:MAG: InlB B-repeat-containing protein, partial [Bacteroidales bacterium]
ITVTVDKSSINTKTGVPAAFKLTIAKPNYTGTFTATYVAVTANGSLAGGAQQILSTGTHDMSFTPSSPGTHTFKMKVQDTKGLKGEVSITVIATNEPLIANINNSNVDIVADEQANLILTVSEANYTGAFTLQYVQEAGAGVFKANDIELGNNATTQIRSGSTNLKYTPSSVDKHLLKLIISDTRGQEQIVSAAVNAKARITATASEGGSVTGSGTYNKDENITLTGVAKEGFKFKQWEENGIVLSNQPSLSFPAAAHRSLTGVFAYDQINVNLSATNGGSVTGSGVYNYNTNLTITATAQTGYKFTGWYEGENQISTATPYSFKTIRDINLQARFAKNSYTITVRNGVGGNVSGGGTYEYGQIATLTAVPVTGYHVLGWYEGSNMVSNAPEYSFEVLSNRSLEAKFAKNKYTVTVTASEGGNVSGGGTYEYGQTATLTAVPVTGYKFVQWSDGTTMTSKSLTVIDNTTISAQFAKNRYTVTATASEGGSVTGGGSFNYDEAATLSAIYDYPYSFNGWYENNTLISSNNPYTFEVLKDRTLDARFSEIQRTVFIDVEVSREDNDLFTVKLSSTEPIRGDFNFKYVQTVYSGTGNIVSNRTIIIKEGSPNPYIREYRFFRDRPFTIIRYTFTVSPETFPYEVGAVTYKLGKLNITQ